MTPKLKPVKLCKGDYIFQKGDLLNGIYFIKEGEAAFVERRNKGDLVFGAIRKGLHFGDTDFTSLKEGDTNRRNFTVKARTDMDLLFLEKEDLLAVNDFFQEEISSLFKHSSQDLEKLKEKRNDGQEWL